MEVSVNGVLVRQDDGLVSTGPLFAAALPLRALGETDKVQFDQTARQAHPAMPEERSAFDRLAAAGGAVSGATTMRVTGPLVREGDCWTLHVRTFQEV